MGKKKSRTNKQKRLPKPKSDELFDLDVLADWFMENLSMMQYLHDNKKDSIEPSVGSDLLLKVVRFWTRNENTKWHFDMIAAVHSRDMYLGKVTKKNLIGQIIWQELLTMIGDGDFDAAKSLLVTHQLLLHNALFHETHMHVMSDFLIEVSRLALEQPCLRSKDTSKILDDMLFFARSQTSVTKWVMNFGSSASDFIFNAPHFKINIVYQSEWGDKTNITLHLNLTIKLKTLIMLVFSRLQINPTNFEIFHIDNGYSSKLLLEHFGEKPLKDLDIKDSNEIHIITAHHSNKQFIMPHIDAISPKKSPGSSKRKPKKKSKQIPSNLSSGSTLPSLKPGSWSSRKSGSSSQPKYTCIDELDKVKHSKQLTLVFEEASDIFRERRQRLNDLALKKCSPKDKSIKHVSRVITRVPVDHSCSPEVDRKAGRTMYHVVVGSEEYLYKSSKSARQIKTPLFSIDLHGCSREEAILWLNDSLHSWIDEAMKEHPWTVRVDIITGGGHQILAEVVEQWIRENKQVANRFL